MAEQVYHGIVDLFFPSKTVSKHKFVSLFTVIRTCMFIFLERSLITRFNF